MQQSSANAERVKDEVAHAIAEKMVEKLAARGGAVEEKRFAVSFLRFGAAPRKAALELLAAEGRVRRIRHASSGKNLVVLAGTDRQKARDELSYVLKLESEIEKERRREMKPTIEEFGVGQSFFTWAEEARAGRVRIEELPFRASAEDLGIETKAERERRERNVARCAATPSTGGVGARRSSSRRPGSSTASAPLLGPRSRSTGPKPPSSGPGWRRSRSRDGRRSTRRARRT